MAELDVKMEIQRPIIEDDDDIQTGDQMSDESDSLFV